MINYVYSKLKKMGIDNFPDIMILRLHKYRNTMLVKNNRSATKIIFSNKKIGAPPNYIKQERKKE